jgi:hypothetical protein
MDIGGITQYPFLLARCNFYETKIVKSLSEILGFHGSEDSYLSLMVIESSGLVDDYKHLLGQEFSFFHGVQTDSGSHPASYPMGTGG